MKKTICICNQAYSSFDFFEDDALATSDRLQAQPGEFLQFFIRNLSDSEVKFFIVRSNPNLVPAHQAVLTNQPPISLDQVASGLFPVPQPGSYRLHVICERPPCSIDAFIMKALG